MRTIIVDGDRESLSGIRQLCAQRNQGDCLACFDDPQDALKYVRESQPEAVILETELPGMDGFALYRRMKELSPELVPVFATKDRSRALEAFEAGAAGYLIKPFTAQQLDEALIRARRLSCPCAKAIEIRTFGHFDVFVHGQPVKFSRQKSKEILAYLVDRWGGIATTQQILADLWEDKAGEKCAMSSFQTAFKSLRADLAKAGIAHILVSNRNQKSINVNCVDCDYYRLMEGDAAALESFPGQYMAEYSWAEPTNANCINLKQCYEDRRASL